MAKSTRRNVCQRKRPYSSPEEALTAARAICLDLRAYRCDRCRTIHLTTRRKGKRIPRPVVDGAAGSD